MSDVDDPVAALADDGTPRGADVVWRAARRRLRQRRVTRVIAGAATTALLVAVVVLALGSRSNPSPVTEGHRGANTSTTSVSPVLAFDVPWVNRPTPPLYIPAPEPTTAPASNAPPCTAGEVSIAPDGTNGGGGTQVYLFSVKNIGSTTCRLGDYPSRVVATEPGLPNLKARDGEPFGDPGLSANVEPGHAGVLALATSDQCANATLSSPYHTVLVTLPGGGVVSVHGTFAVSCGIATSRLGLTQPAPEYPTQWYESVSASVQAPPAVAAGSTLTYVVTLTNDTAKAVKIDHCVGYYEHGVDGAVDAGDHFALNCDAVRRIGAHAHLRYQMKLAIPADAPTGAMTVQWTISQPAAKLVTAETTVEVRGNDHPCAAEQVTATAQDPASPFRGSGIYFVKDAGTTLDVTVTNTSSTSCTLQGSPEVRILSARGTDLGVKYVTRGLSIGSPPPPGSRVSLSPGQSATSTLAWHSRWCAADPNPVRVELTLPTNSNLVTINPTHGWKPPGCSGFAWNSVSSEPFR